MLKRKRAKKIQRPIDYDIHLKYRCKSCDQDHWLSYLEASTNNFKVVCDCGTVFKLKRVVGFTLKYQKTTIKNKEEIEQVSSLQKESSCLEIDLSEKVKLCVPENLLQSSMSILGGFGYSKIEAFNMITDSYEKLKTDSVGDLVKFALANCK